MTNTPYRNGEKERHQFPSLLEETGCFYWKGKEMEVS